MKEWPILTNSAKQSISHRSCTKFWSIKAVDASCIFVIASLAGLFYQTNLFLLNHLPFEKQTIKFGLRAGIEARFPTLVCCGVGRPSQAHHSINGQPARRGSFVALNELPGPSGSVLRNTARDTREIMRPGVSHTSLTAALACLPDVAYFASAVYLSCCVNGPF